MNTAEATALDEIRAAVKGKCRFVIVRLYLGPTREAVQVEACGDEYKARWRKVGPLLFPPDGGTTADTLSMLMTMRGES